MKRSVSPRPITNSGVGELELRPDGWERFIRAVDAAVASGPKHRKSENTKKNRKRKKGRFSIGSV